MKIDIVVLAAGQGTRMRSELPKVLHSIGGKPMVQHVVDTASSIDDSRVHVVVGHGGDTVREGLRGECNFVEQSERLGTGHAVDQATPNLAAESKVLILYGDVPLIQLETLQHMLDSTNDDAIAVLTANLSDPTGYGRIVRAADGRVLSIVEQKDASDEQLLINEINTGIMCVPSKLLRQWLPQLSNDNAQQEYYLTDVIALAADSGIAINTPQPDSLYEVQGVNDRQQLAMLEREYQKGLASNLMREGATLADPARVDIRGSVVTGNDVFIDVNVVFEGEVVLGSNVSIGPNCVIKNSNIGSGTRIHENCVLEDAITHANCSVGPFARLRPAAVLEDEVRVGNFVEVKKSRLKVGAKANHLAYIGDAEVGCNSNIGAGTITCNYDGANKFKTELGNNVFIGSNSTLVAPVKIADDAFVGAGSTITKMVASGILAIGRGKQKNIEGWQKPVKQAKTTE